MCIRVGGGDVSAHERQLDLRKKQAPYIRPKPKIKNRTLALQSFPLLAQSQGEGKKRKLNTQRTYKILLSTQSEHDVKGANKAGRGPRHQSTCKYQYIAPHDTVHTTTLFTRERLLKLQSPQLREIEEEVDRTLVFNSGSYVSIYFVRFLFYSRLSHILFSTSPPPQTMCVCMSLLGRLFLQIYHNLK